MAEDLILRQVHAVIDRRTTVVCLHAAGQIRPILEPFDTLLGQQDDTPFHIRCRSMVVPYMKGFVSDTRTQANAELMRRPLKQRRIGPNGETGPLPPKSGGSIPPKPLPPAPLALKSGEDAFRLAYDDQQEVFERLLQVEGDRAPFEFSDEWKRGDTYDRVQELLFAGKKSGDIDGYHFDDLREFLEAADRTFDSLPGLSEDIVTRRITSRSYSSIRDMLDGDEGDTFRTDGFLATTTSSVDDLRRSGLGSGGSVVMEIVIPRGSKVLSVDAARQSGRSGEGELLVNRGSRLMLQGKPKEVDGKWIVRLVLV